MICLDVRVRMHESHYAGRAIIIFRYFFRSHKFALLKIFVSFQVSDVLCTPKRSELASRDLAIAIQGVSERIARSDIRAHVQCTRVYTHVYVHAHLINSAHCSCIYGTQNFKCTCTCSTHSYNDRW